MNKYNKLLIMECKEINGKKIYIVEKHNEILEAWEIYKNQGYNVITLDSHKDTELCFRMYLGKNNHLTRELLIDDYSIRNKNIEDIIEKLRNDEHIDFATRSKMISKVFVIAYVCGDKKYNDNIFHKEDPGAIANVYNNEPIIQYNNRHFLESINDSNNCPKESDETYIRKNALSNEVLNDAISSFKAIDSNCLDKYILDIDLDYICTIYAFDKDLTVFKDLIKNAAAITIAKESDCVKNVNNDFKDELDKRLENKKYFAEKLTSEKVLASLLEATKQVN